MKRFAGMLLLLLAACDYETVNVYVECCEGCDADAGPGPDAGQASPDSGSEPDADLPDAGDPEIWVCPPGAQCPCDVEDPYNENACHDAASTPWPDAEVPDAT